MTIVAIATPLGRGGVGVLRVSGPRVRKIASEMLGALPQARLATLLPFFGENKEVLDIGIGLFFPAPNSFTGEDVLELQGHGGTVVLDRILQRILSLGARLARPGEFCERAFLCGKMDLSQCEAVADLIDAATWQAAKGAMRSLQGAFSEAILQFNAVLIELRALVETTIDFPEEEIDSAPENVIQRKIETLITDLQQCLLQSQQGALLREGAHVVIVGGTNVGKSSLLNCLAGVERAIVTELPGTTRDCIQETIQIDGIPIHIVDTAGLREAQNVVEKEGIRRAKAQMKKADCIIQVMDLTHPENQTKVGVFGQECTRHVLLCMNKVDLTTIKPGQEQDKIYVSAKTGAGIDVLRQAIKRHVCEDVLTEDVFVARARHIYCLKKALQCCVDGRLQWVRLHASELLAENLRDAQQALSEITGAVTTEDLLGKIFSTFCIGK